jgi:poly(A)-specific ribonuclease
MDVTCENFEDACTFFEELLPLTDFIAFDMEMTGISPMQRNPFGRHSPFDPPHERYLSNREGVMNYMMCQLGFCLVRLDESTQTYRMHPFNFNCFPFSQQWVNDPHFTCQASSLKFLASTQFDFNKWIYKGIPFVSLASSQKIEKSLQRELDEKMKTADSVLNGFLKDEDKTFVDTKREEIEVFWQQVQAGEAQSLSLPINNPFNRKLAYAVVEKYYPQFQTERLKSGPGIEVISRPSTSPNPVEAAQQALQATLKQAAGLRRIVDAIFRSKKPLIGHNCLQDFMHLHRQFIDDVLPPNLDDFCEKIRDYSPAVYDTKYICQTIAPLKSLVVDTALEPAFKTVHSTGVSSKSGYRG